MSPTSSILTHEWIWNAIDALARHKELSSSGLARLAGLDPTAFNPSKRFTPEGRPRWPSTESISKILTATGFTLDEFTALAAEAERSRQAPIPANVPLIGQITNATVSGWHTFGSAITEGLDANAKLVVGGGGPFAVEAAVGTLAPVYRCRLKFIRFPNINQNGFMVFHRFKQFSYTHFLNPVFRIPDQLLCSFHHFHSSSLIKISFICYKC